MKRLPGSRHVDRLTVARRLDLSLPQFLDLSWPEISAFLTHCGLVADEHLNSADGV